MEFVESLAILLILFGVILAIVTMFLARNNRNIPLKRGSKNPRFAFLIPARDESKVIRGLLDSIKKQTYPLAMEDVYVIVESLEDPTCQILKEYGASLVLRQHLELKRKGYALDEAVKQILENKKTYDAYFIVDADNILDQNYLYRMAKIYEMGYDVGSGYRNLKNGNTNWISATSGLIFSLINAIGNEEKVKYNQNIVTIGSGFYIRGEFIEKWKGFPFHSLSEDYEFSLYATLHGMTTYYAKDAVIYDEQPITYKQTVIQRIRWIRGYFDARKEYVPKLRKKLEEKPKNSGSILGAVTGVIPYLFIVAGLIIFLIHQLCILVAGVIIYEKINEFAMLKSIIALLSIYFVLFLLTIVILVKEQPTIRLSTKMKIFALLIHPFFLITYLPCVIKALTKKEVEWSKIEHHEKEIVES